MFTFEFVENKSQWFFLVEKELIQRCGLCHVSCIYSRIWWLWWRINPSPGYGCSIALECIITTHVNLLLNTTLLPFIPAFINVASKLTSLDLWLTIFLTLLASSWVKSHCIIHAYLQKEIIWQNAGMSMIQQSVVGFPRLSRVRHAPSLPVW